MDILLNFIKDILDILVMEIEIGNINFPLFALLILILFLIVTLIIVFNKYRKIKIENKIRKEKEESLNKIKLNYKEKHLEFVNFIEGIFPALDGFDMYKEEILKSKRYFKEIEDNLDKYKVEDIDKIQSFIIMIDKNIETYSININSHMIRTEQEKYAKYIRDSAILKLNELSTLALSVGINNDLTSFYYNRLYNNILSTDDLKYIYREIQNDISSIKVRYKSVLEGKKEEVVVKYDNEIKAAYDKLGLTYGSDIKVVKKRFTKLVKECHPDLVEETPERVDRTKELNRAYDILSNYLRK